MYIFTLGTLQTFQLTRSVGSVTESFSIIRIILLFQLTRSVGSVTQCVKPFRIIPRISTHTLRGERDYTGKTTVMDSDDFNSHAPWGA